MIAQQVAGKATRDALFLTSFKVEDLPPMVIASAVLSLCAVLWVAGRLVRHTPAKVVPLVFAVSAAGLLAEWGLAFTMPRVAAVALYFHSAVFGAIVVSAFWSLVTETFRGHSARRAVTWIAGGGTAGGVIGGLITWRLSDVVPLASMLPVLAAINAICVWGCLRLQATPKSVDTPAETEVEPLPEPVEVIATPEVPRATAFAILRGAPYLQNLAFVVGLGAVTSSLLDYVFYSSAVQHYAKGPQLLAFFAQFWLVVGLLSFFVQTVIARYALEKLGVGITVAMLPALVLVGGVAAFAAPGLASTVFLRGSEATHTNSLFRSAYELLYAPLSEEKKRATKTIIDVGCDRLGTAAAGGIAMATLALVTRPRAGLILLVIAMACAFVCVVRSLRLHGGYVGLLEDGLRQAADQMTPTIVPVPAQSAREVAVRDAIVEQLEPDLEARRTGAPVESIDNEVQSVLALRSGEKVRVRAVLASDEPLTAPLVAFAVLLLADKEFHIDAINALVKAAPSATGQLVDALCDPRVDFHARRRIPRVLARCPTIAAAEGLLRGLNDERFEVRFACGRALLNLRAKSSVVAISVESVVAAVKREIEHSTHVWDPDVDSDDDDDDQGIGGEGEDAPHLVERLRRDRLDRNVEHIFNLLALHLDPASLRTAFKALHEADDALRGTALEYLETVLPGEVRDLVWPFFGEIRPMRAARPANEILADLEKARKA